MILEKISNTNLNEAARNFSCAFFNDPLYKWFFKNEKSRKEKAKYFFKYELLESINSSYESVDGSVFAIFQKPNDIKSKVGIFFEIKLFFKVGICSTIRAIKYLRFSERQKKKYIKPGDTYAKLLCVDEKYRGQGLARQAFEAFEGNVFLETQNPINTKIYEKIGFKLVAQIKFTKDITHYVMRKTKN